MAYITGLVSPDEYKELEARGWEVHNISNKRWAAMFDHDPDSMDGDPDPDPFGLVYVWIWVDADVLDVMTGPDWETRAVNSDLRTDG